MSFTGCSLHGDADDDAFRKAYGLEGDATNVKHDAWITAGCGVKEYYFVDPKALPTPIDAQFDPQCTTDLPDLTHHNSYIVDLLKTEEGKKMWEEMKTKKTSKGVTLAKCIKTGMDNKGHPNIKTVGLVGGDEDCFINDENGFKKLFEHVTRARHGFMTGDHKSDMNVEGLSTVDMDPFCAYVHTARVRTGRSVKGYCLPPSNSFEERRKLEKAITDALLTLTGELAGTKEGGGGYFPLPGSKSNPQKDDRFENGMTEAYGKELLAMGNLFQEPDSTLLLSGGMGRHWPDARGIYHNDQKNLFVWLNEEDHMRVVSMQGKKGTCSKEGKDMRAVAKRFMDACNAVESVGLNFMKSDALGWILTCPSNCGTGLRAGCQVDVRNLYSHITANDKNPGAWKAAMKGMALQARGTGGVDDTSVTVFDISNADRMGKTDVTLTNICIDGIAFLTCCEHALVTDPDKDKDKDNKEKTEYQKHVDAALEIATGSDDGKEGNVKLQAARAKILELIPTLKDGFKEATPLADLK